MKVTMNNFEYPYEKYYSQIVTALLEIKEAITGKAIDKNKVILTNKKEINNLIRIAECVVKSYNDYLEAKDGKNSMSNYCKFNEAISILSQAIEKCREERKI